MPGDKTTRVEIRSRQDDPLPVVRQLLLQRAGRPGLLRRKASRLDVPRTGEHTEETSTADLIIAIGDDLIGREKKLSVRARKLISTSVCSGVGKAQTIPHAEYMHVTSHTTCRICMDVTESDTSKKGSRTHEHQNFCMLRGLSTQQRIQKTKRITRCERQQQQR